MMKTTNSVAFYNTNGSGRDQYIACNNGGFTSTHSNAGGIESGTFQKLAKRNIDVQVGIKSPSKRFHYNLDGSGRDTYIFVDQGGFMFLTSPQLQHVRLEVDRAPQRLLEEP